MPIKLADEELIEKFKEEEKVHEKVALEATELVAKITGPEKG